MEKPSLKCLKIRVFGGIRFFNSFFSMYFYTAMQSIKTYIKPVIVAAVLLNGTAFTFAQKVSGQKREVSKSASVELLLDTAEVKMKEDLPEAFDYLQKALQTSISKGDKYGEVRSYQLLGRTHYDLSQYDLAVDYFRKARKYESVLSSREQMRLNYEYSLALEKNHDGLGAIRYLKVAIGQAQAAGLIEDEVKMRYDLARIYQAGDNPTAAIEEYNAIEDLENTLLNLRGVAQANNMRGSAYQKKNKSQEAITNYQNAERIADEINADDLKTEALRNQATVYRQNQQYSEELKVRQEALEISNRKSPLKEAAEDNLMIGDLYLQTQQPSEALPYIRKSVDLAEKSGDLPSKGKALKKLSEVYDRQGASDKALLSYKQYAETMDSVYASRERELQKNLDWIAEMNRKLQRIELLEQDYELTRKTVELLEKEQNFTSDEQQFMKNKLDFQRGVSFALVILVFGLGLSTFLIYRSSRQKRKANLLLALRSLRSQMNPHFIFNSLNSVNAYIAANDERKANKYLSDFSKLMRQVLENSKHDFVALGSEIDVLKLYLKLEHSRFAERFDYTFEVDEQLMNAEYTVPPMLIQPYIENAIWHGLRYREEKGSLDVEMRLEQGILMAEVRDNGIGRSRSQELKTAHQQQNKSTGMKNTRSRLDIINEVYALKYEVEVGDLDLETGTGTRVLLKIPLAKQEIKD
ncbi:MAG: tetratricopeptide repeat protein [Bacteroidales bacterium]|nr:tetratricopeptide repeat protein [Bacteroidales bacterium]